jgi:hypothetical protein
MDGSSIWWVAQGAVVAAAAVALVYGLWLQRTQLHGARVAGEVARETARLALQAAELHAQSIQSARAAVEAAARVQRLAARPVLKVGLGVKGLMDVGRTPVVFFLRVTNVGHGTAVIEQVRLLVRGEPALTYGSADAGPGPTAAQRAAQLAAQVETRVFQRAVGASLQALSGHLTVLPLTDDVRALEVSGCLDLLRVQVYAHNADAVEQGLRTLSAEVSYRDLDGGLYTSTEQFRSF